MVTAVAVQGGVIGHPNPGNPTQPWVLLYNVVVDTTNTQLSIQVFFDPNSSSHRLRSDTEADIKAQVIALGFMTSADDVLVVGL